MAGPNLRLVDRDDQHARDRAIMVARHLKARFISDPLVLAAMSEIPREAFISEPLQEFAYEDSLPIEAGQTISQPYIVARMLELAEVRPGDKVFEVGAGQEPLCEWAPPFLSQVNLDFGRHSGKLLLKRIIVRYLTTLGTGVFRPAHGTSLERI